MAVKREKIHFETVEELLGAPVTKDATTEIRIDQIFPFENHPFKVVDDDKMEELVESIRENEVLSPVLVRPDGYVAWVGMPTGEGPARALTTWCGPPAAASRGRARRH